MSRTARATRRWSRARRWATAAAVVGTATVIRRLRTDARSPAAPAAPASPAAPVGFDGLEVDPIVIETDDGARLRGVATGPADGPLVVLSHGWMANQGVWGPVARALAAHGFRVVAHDQRGHGTSTSGTAPLTVDRLGRDLGSVLDTLRASDAVLVGHSMGGMSVQALAASDPDLASRVRGIVLVSTAARAIPFAVPTRVANLLVGDRASKRLARQSLERHRRSFGSVAHPEHLRAVHDARIDTDGATRADCLVAISRMDYWRRLDRVTVPVRVLVGSQDRTTPPVRSRRLIDVIPGARLMLLDGVGHMLPLEAPDAVVAAVDSLAPTASRSPLLDVTQGRRAPGSAVDGGLDGGVVV